jgi:predicted nucleotidyltransferase
MKRRLALDPSSVALPKGTRVVLTADAPLPGGGFLKRGSVARVIACDHPDYTVQAPDGRAAPAPRTSLTVQSERMADTAVERAWTWDTLADHVILEVVVGSTAWGLAGPTSDEDLRGAFLLPFDLSASLFDPPDELQPAGAEAQYWEVGKLIRAGLRGEANVLEALWTPLVKRATPAGEWLRERRGVFTSKRIHQSFGRYAMSQLQKMQARLTLYDVETAILDHLADRPDAPRQAVVAALTAAGAGDEPTSSDLLLRVTHAWFDRGLIASRRFEDFAARASSDPPPREPWRPKNAYNLLRLLHSAHRWLATGAPMIEVDEPDLRARLLAIKGGQVSLDDVVAEAQALSTGLDAAAAASALPDEPDHVGADALLRDLRDHAARRHLRLPTARPAASSAPNPTARPATVTAPGAAAFARATGLDLVVVGLHGSHAFGFPTATSDLDLKGLFLAPAEALLGLAPPPPTDNRTGTHEGVTLDLTLHEAGHALHLLVRGNGNIAEYLLGCAEVLPGPDPAQAAQRLAELRDLTRASLHRGFLPHYAGFLRQVTLQSQRAPTLKSWLYAFRVGLTGAHLLRTGRLVTDLRDLAPDAGYAYVLDLIAQRQAGDAPDPALADRVLRDLSQLAGALTVAASPLPEACPNRGDIDAWLRWWRTVPVAEDLHP